MKNVFRNGLFFVITGIFFVSGGDILAYTIDRTPAGNVSSESFTININNSAPSICEEIPAFPPFFQASGAALEYRLAFYQYAQGSGVYIVKYGDWYDINNTGPKVYTNSVEEDVYFYRVECRYENYDDGSSQTIEDNNDQQIDFSFLAFTAPPPGPVAAAPLRFSLFATSTPSTDILASVAGSVQETGKAIWPMFAFLGVGAAFIIALQVMVFTKRAVNGTGGPNDGKSSRSDGTKRRKKGRKRRKI